jgi:hypothetical protein
MLKIPPEITGPCFPSGYAMTEPKRPVSLIVIGHNPRDPAKSFMRSEVA